MKELRTAKALDPLHSLEVWTHNASIRLAVDKEQSGDVHEGSKRCDATNNVLEVRHVIHISSAEAGCINEEVLLITDDSWADTVLQSPCNLYSAFIDFHVAWVVLPDIMVSPVAKSKPVSSCRIVVFPVPD